MLWYVAVHSGYIAGLDDSIYWGFHAFFWHSRAGSLAWSIAELCSVVPYILISGTLVVLALRGGRRDIAVAILVIVIGSAVSAEALKPLLGIPRAGTEHAPVDLASFPSGTSAAAMALVLSAVLASPPARRPWVAAFGAGFALAVVYSVLILGWHYPSDTLGGLLVSSIWALVAVAGIRIAEARRASSPAPAERAGPEPGRPERVGPEPSVTRAAVSTRTARLRSLTPSTLAISLALALGVLIFALRPAGALAYARDHTAFVVGAGSLGCLSLMLTTAVMLTTLRR